MLVSIAIAVKNGARTIINTLNSLQKQTHTEFECIIVDDNSDDDTCNVVYHMFVKHDNRFKLFINYADPDNRYVDAHNKSYELCTGKYIFRVDADDIFDMDYLEFCINFFESHPDVDAISTCQRYVHIDDNGISKNIASSTVIDNTTAEKCNFFNNNIRWALCYNTFTWANPTSVIRNEWLKKNNIKYEYFACGDYIFWLNCAIAGCRFYKLPDIKSYGVEHSNNISSKDEFYEDENISISQTINSLRDKCLSIYDDNMIMPDGCTVAQLRRDARNNVNPFE